MGLKAVTFPLICRSSLLKVDVTNYPHIEALNLAHDFADERHDSIDIQIGSDYYWDIVTGETERDFGPTAVNNKPVFMDIYCLGRLGPQQIVLYMEILGNVNNSPMNTTY